MTFAWFIQQLKNDWNKITNLVTETRLLLFWVPAAMLLLGDNTFGMHLSAMATFIVLALLDSLDGYLARTLKMKTELGRILDPLADKLLTLSTLGALIIVNPLILWLVIFIGTGEVTLAIWSTYCVKVLDKSMAVLPIGKLKMAMLMATVACLFLPAVGVWRFVVGIMVATTITITVISWYKYWSKCRNKIK